MHAMILAAGFGTRLWPLTVDRTKPAIPVLNRPLITYSVEYLRRAGIRNMVVNLHHQGDSIQSALGDGSQLDCHITYSNEEDKILGTSGALDFARHHLEHGTFVVMNGKVITNIDLAAALETHHHHQALATLVLRPNRNRERFSMIEVDHRGWITQFAGFPTPEQMGEPFMFTGIQILEPEIFDYIPRGVFSHSTTDVYPKAMAQGRPIVAHVADGKDEFWYEFSTLARYFDLSFYLLQKQDPLSHVIQGRNCQIDTNACLQDCILWDRVTVEAESYLKDCILGDDVKIPSGTNLERVVIVRMDKLSAEDLASERGTIAGENFLLKF